MAFRIPIEGAPGPEEAGRAPKGEARAARRSVRVPVAGEDDTEGRSTAAGPESLRIRQGGASVVSAGHVTIEQGAAGAIVADRVEGNGIHSVLLIAREVKGDVRTVFTPASAAAFGAGLGLVLGLERLFSRER
jgi:hypothetical protein